MIHEHRHEILSAFCQQKGMSIPMYGKQKNGKPIITNSRLAFNQSHTDDGYALAFSTSVRNLGVDIENLNRRANFESLAKRFFHADEQALWQQTHKNQQWWLKIWTIKEAVLKANGLGIRLPLNELNAVFINDHQGELYHQLIGCYRFECVMIDGHVMTIAYEGDWQPWEFYHHVNG
ncbi:4'-phosphopantetheinyl transferase superfamily protein [Moraxella sp. Tifton1]|uniref:4'-phosphopantetheinyl transferase family protein n=1 Tax=Moraxella oculi TaxID=2940516 RepID=A0ABW8U570_9GAMM|nr:4'-phosphopantetheinyl transferase superfamily protein [Moraxella sp. Tifton1]MCL1622704.1 4'-phosphopantetheinyl transferase superfamily protein [Moraxella sp. Tifton1]